MTQETLLKDFVPQALVAGARTTAPTIVGKS